jgi:hypothetical protein
MARGSWPLRRFLKRPGRYKTYCPVAVTPQETTKLTVAVALNVGIIAPPGLCNAANNAAGVPAGQVAVPVVVQVAEVQLKPVTEGSLTIELGAFAGPRFETVTV